MSAACLVRETPNVRNTFMDIAFTILGALLLIVGFIGCIMPIPGVPIAWFALLLLYFVDFASIALSTLIITAVVVIIVSVADYLAQPWLTKKTGGTKEGVIGSTIGILVGIPFGFLGVILCPLLGALIGEIIHDKDDMKKAFTSALGSFLGFLLGTGIKLITCGVFTLLFITALF